MGNNTSHKENENNLNINNKKYIQKFENFKKENLNKDDIYNLYNKKYLSDLVFNLMNKNNVITKKEFINFYNIILKHEANSNHMGIISILIKNNYNEINLNTNLNTQEKNNFIELLKENFKNIKDLNYKLDLNDKEYNWNQIKYKFSNLFPNFLFFVYKYINNILLDFSENIFPKYDINVSNILNDEIVLYLSLYNKKIFESPKFQLLYSTKQNGNSFFQLANKVRGYKKPMVILIRNYFSIMNDNFNGIFGAYSNSEILDILGYCGDHNSFLFSIKENLEFISTQTGDGTSNYVFMNSKKLQNSKYKTGLGFGGINFDGFRLWIDDDILNKSYIRDEYKTYGRGNLSKSVDDFLKINVLEVWGLGDIKDLQDQQNAKLLNEQVESNNRKIDKKFLLESDFNKQMFLGNTFKHQEQMEKR